MSRKQKTIAFKVRLKIERYNEPMTFERIRDCIDRNPLVFAG
jgi:hypothetical protein